MKLWELKPLGATLWSSSSGFKSLPLSIQACDVPISPEFKDPVGLTFKTASLS